MGHTVAVEDSLTRRGLVAGAHPFDFPQGRLVEAESELSGASSSVVALSKWTRSVIKEHRTENERSFGLS